MKELGVWLLLIARFYHREDHNLWGFKFLLDLMGTLRHEEGREIFTPGMPGWSQTPRTDYRIPPGRQGLFSWRSSLCRWSGRRWCSTRGWSWGWWGGWGKRWSHLIRSDPQHLNVSTSWDFKVLSILLQRRIKWEFPEGGREEDQQAGGDDLGERTRAHLGGSDGSVRTHLSCHNEVTGVPPTTTPTTDTTNHLKFLTSIIRLKSVSTWSVSSPG